MISATRLTLGLFMIVVAALLIPAACFGEEDIFSGRYRVADKNASAEEKELILVLEKVPQGWNAHFKAKGVPDAPFLMEPDTREVPNGWRCLTFEERLGAFCAVPPGTEVDDQGKSMRINSGYFILVQGIGEMEKIK